MASRTRTQARKFVPLLAVAALLIGIIGAQSNGVAYDETIATLPPCPSQSPSPSASTTPSIPGTGSPSPEQAPCNPADLHPDLGPETGVWGTTFKVYGLLTCKDQAVADARIVIHETTAGVTTTYAATTAPDGAYTWPDKPSSKTTYQVAWAGGGSCPAGAVAPLMTAQVRPGVIVNVAKPVLDPGTRAVLTGKVLPAHAGARVTLQMLQGQGGAWKTVADAHLNSKSQYTLTYWTEFVGHGIFRVAYPTSDTDHLWNVSRTVSITWTT